MPWLSRAKQPGGVPEADVHGGLLTLGIYLVLWSIGLLNLIRDERRGYASWKLALSCLLLAFALVVPVTMGVSAVRYLLK